MDAIETELAVGLESTINDPFVVRRGGRASFTVRPIRWVGVGAIVGGYPDLGAGDLTGATRALIQLNLVTPDVSRVIGLGTVVGEVTPLSMQGEVGWALHLRVGGGTVYTVDDLELTGNDSSAALAFQKQFHPQWSWELAADATLDRWGLRVHFGQLRYTERVAENDERKAPLWMGVDGTVRLGRVPERIEE
ncbi:MAG: hypothetical protein H6738_22285 [Alphaproteobacteria bacterium]|nr:hypothetical protein [Alphaproteobacteria bacterium]MCB9699529.1 hypothetical protein [Alphaproteobacteria bacterium]